MGSDELKVVEKRPGIFVDFGVVSFEYFTTFLL